VRLEMRDVLLFLREQPYSPFVLLLLGGRLNDGIDHSLIEFERVGKMLPHVRRNRPRSQRLAERSVRAANAAVSEPPSEIAPAQPECPRAINKKPGDRIAVLPETQSKSRTHAASIRLRSRTGLVGSIRRFSRFVWRGQADHQIPPWRRKFAVTTKPL
jgi:hypothetical protein